MNLHIPNSYKIQDEYEIRSRVTFYYTSGMLGHSRTIESYIHEWVAHNVLYNLGLFRSHTKDVDLNDDEPKWRLWIYDIIYVLNGKQKL